jgi:hypothetical protein
MALVATTQQQQIRCVCAIAFHYRPHAACPAALASPLSRRHQRNIVLLQYQIVDPNYLLVVLQPSSAAYSGNICMHLYTESPQRRLVH